MIDKFNIRVYGLLVNEDKILLSSESIDDFHMIKFPGGGLEFGEGITDCIKREFKEELDLSIMIYDQIYITDHFIQSAFRKNEQVIAIYYWVETIHDIKEFQTTQQTRMGSKNELKFKWETLSSNLLNKLSFPSDKLALQRLMAKINTMD